MKTKTRMKMMVLMISLSLLIIGFSITESLAYQWTIHNKTEYPVSVQIVILVPEQMLYKSIPLKPDRIMPGGKTVFSDRGYYLEEVRIWAVISENETRQLESVACDIKRRQTVFNLNASIAAGNLAFKLCDENDSKCRDLKIVTAMD